MTDDLTYSEWYRQEYARAYRALLGFCGSSTLAEDALAEAFLKAYRHWARVVEMPRPRSWLLAVAFNEVRRTAVKDASTASAVRDTPTLDVALVEVVDLLSRLPERQRAATVLRYVCDLPEAEIADVLGISRGTVSRSLSRSRRWLRSHIDVGPTKEGLHVE
jgi:RNA polymerase sigma factor (sigma-70 family)